MTRISYRGALLGIASLVGLVLAGCPAEPEESGHGHAGLDNAGSDHAEHDHGGHDQPGRDHGHDHAKHGHPEDRGEHELTAVELQPYFHTVKIPAAVRLDPDRKATISAPIAGRILALDAPPHAAVRAGQRLALLELTDPDGRHLQMRAVQTRAELIAARTERNRMRQYLDKLDAGDTALAEERRRVTADLEVLQARVRSLDSGLSAILTSLKAAGLTASQLERLEQKGEVSTRIALTAPRLPGSPDLEVAARPVSVGGTVTPGERLFDLVALDRLLVVGEAFEADLAAVRRAAREELPVTLLLPGERRDVQDLRIRSIEGALDGEDRITHFFVWLPNQSRELRREGKQRYLDWEFRAGSRAQLLVPTGTAEPHFVLPSAAVVRDGERQWIFRKHGEHFERLAVTPETMDDRVAVLGADCGLEAGDEVVTQGALQVHLRLLRAVGGSGQAGGHHGHGHGQHH